MNKDLMKKKVAEQQNIMLPPKSPAQVSWKSFFDEHKVVPVQDVVRVTILYNFFKKFSVYTCNHNTENATDCTILVLLHGGGLTSFSWALFARLLKEQHKYKIVTFDFRGHGQTTSSNDLDLSEQTLTQDAIQLLQTLYKPDSNVSLVLCGHSLGASIAVKVATTMQQQNLFQIKGVVMIDVVEGTALCSLASMHDVLKKRPQLFGSTDAAARYYVESGQYKNLESAKLSVPSQLVHTADGYRWRTPLEKTEQFWQGWFSGLSNLFLNVVGPKLLILAGPDRLDKTLMIGQMQGKFQLQVLQSQGHFAHEDNPQLIANVVSNFVSKFKLL